MKIIYYMISSILLFIGCNDKGKTILPLKTEDTGTYIDERDNTEYQWIQLGHLQWMTENLKYSFEFQDDYYDNYYLYNYRAYYEIELTDAEREKEIKDNIGQYGYLYDYSSALLAIPKGWRLPTDEDWKNLEQICGMSQKEANKLGWRGNFRSIILQEINDETGLNISLGGMINFWDGNFEAINIKSNGYYWTSTTSEDSVEPIVYYRSFGYKTHQICRDVTLQKKMMSVRCVRDIASSSK